METVRLLSADGTLTEFENNWKLQCSEVEEDFNTFASGPISVIRSFANEAKDNEWAIAIKDGDQTMATACAILANQKGYVGSVLRVREVTVCPLLDYGNLDENTYIDTLIEILNGALKLSERELKAKHIKLHLRSPADAVFFRAFRNTLDSKGAFAATEAHGAWLTFSKAQGLQTVK